MSRPPALAASRNMSACKVHAVSQVGCRLMVASSAKIRRPRLSPALEGPSERTRSTNASISGRDEAGAGDSLEGSSLMAKVYTDLGTIGERASEDAGGGLRSRNQPM